MQGGREVSGNVASRCSALQFAPVGWLWLCLVDSEPVACDSTEALVGKTVSMFTAGSAFWGMISRQQI